MVFSITNFALHTLHIFPSMAIQRILQNNRLLWVDSTISQNDVDTRKTLQELRAAVDHVDLFTQIDDCLSILGLANKGQALIITFGSLG